MQGKASNEDLLKTSRTGWRMLEVAPLLWISSSVLDSRFCDSLAFRRALVWHRY